jgi:hypothetical protein
MTCAPGCFQPLRERVAVGEEGRWKHRRRSDATVLSGQARGDFGGEGGIALTGSQDRPQQRLGLLREGAELAQQRPHQSLRAGGEDTGESGRDRLDGFLRYDIPDQRPTRPALRVTSS